jgi:SAM-dependent methyltransferase
VNRVAEVYDWAGLLVRDYVHSRYAADAEVLDVGTGYGKYRVLLRAYPHVDGCEVWEPTVERENLRLLYRNVIIGDFYDVVHHDDWDDRYDLVIMGDVLEHIARPAAQGVVERVIAGGAELLVVVPFMYPQDEEDGNVYQRHLQDDLTPELMAAAYPQLRLIALETRDLRPFKGIYVGSRRG